eukprot:scpid97885/ scgid34857/ 
MGLSMHLLALYRAWEQGACNNADIGSAAGPTGAHRLHSSCRHQVSVQTPTRNSYQCKVQGNKEEDWQNQDDCNQHGKMNMHSESLTIGPQQQLETPQQP